MTNGHVNGFTVSARRDGHHPLIPFSQIDRLDAIAQEVLLDLGNLNTIENDIGDLIRKAWNDLHILIARIWLNQPWTS